MLPIGPATPLLPPVSRGIDLIRQDQTIGILPYFVVLLQSPQRFIQTFVLALTKLTTERLLELFAGQGAFGFKFSDDGYEELKTLFDMTIENLRAAQSILVTGDFELARRLMESKVDIRRLEKQSSNRHLERLRDGLTESMQTSSLHLDMLRDLKRINAHIVSVAHPILDESRLRYAEPRA